MNIFRVLSFLIAMATATDLVAASSLPTSSEDQMKVLRKAVEDARATSQKARNDADYKILGNYYHSLAETNLPRILDLTKTSPGSRTAFEMLSWIVMEGGTERGPVWTNRLQAVEQLARYHATNAGVSPLCAFIGNYWVWRWREHPVTDFLQAVAKNNPVRANQGQAVFSLAALNVCKFEDLTEFEQWGNAPFYTGSIAKFETTDLTQWGNSKSAADQATLQLKDVLANYGDYREWRPQGSKEQPLLKTEAEKKLHQLLHLSLGKVAPNIEANSIDGKKFKLSDSRGKITVLSFWASWCGPCMRLVPVERALTQRMKGKPFTVIGVDGDGIISDARHAVKHEKMMWPSFWNGEEGSSGPISSGWNVTGWPTVYVLDANGIIRFKFEGYGDPAGTALNGCVDELIKELERGQDMKLAK